MTILLWAAVLPPLFLMWKIYKMDKIEREPIGLIIALIIGGAIACFPAGLIESFLESNVLSRILDPSSVPYQVIMNFIIVAGAEEGFKYLVLKKITWNNRNFDYRFDGVIYAVATSLGFAALENIMYVAEGGLAVALPRALLAIPGHCIFGIFMGDYYGMAKQFSRYEDGSEKRCLRLAVLHPMLLHGFYDFCLSTGSDIFGIIFFIYVIVLDILAYKSIKKMASGDIKL